MWLGRSWRDVVDVTIVVTLLSFTTVSLAGTPTIDVFAGLADGDWLILYDASLWDTIDRLELD